MRLRVGREARTGVSLCLIVRNEEANLPDCLGSVEGLFDDVVVVDTGSTDATAEVARRFGARVFDFPWIDSFAAAATRASTTPAVGWVLWLDADDRLDEDNRQRLRRLLAGLGDERDAYAVVVRSVLDARRTAFRLLDQVRLFRNLPENPLGLPLSTSRSCRRCIGLAAWLRWTDVVVDHVG